MLVRTNEAAKRLQLSVSTITKMRMRREGPAYLKLGRIVAYDTADLDAWAAAQRVANDNARSRAIERVAA